ncbi:MAG TPA: super-infection exclusion protein B [Verrucomicrobiae bacterium]|nr:super-infection exclusion protein B [Verrucomicrobiae bacterium]
MSPWPDWLKVIQLKPRFLFGLWLLGAIILLSPNGIAENFGIKNIRESFRGWIGIGTLAAFAFWCVQLIPLYQTKRNNKKRRQKIIQALNSLSGEERVLLAYCVCRNQQTINLEITHRAASALVAKSMLVMASGIGNQLAWPFSIPDFLWEHLRDNPDAVLQGIAHDDPQLEAHFYQIDRHIRR